VILVFLEYGRISLAELIIVNIRTCLIGDCVTECLQLHAAAVHPLATHSEIVPTDEQGDDKNENPDSDLERIEELRRHGKLDLHRR
jgi:hypothetical protein